jgi:formamidopyrimidine-DNA glycosylase
MPELPEVENVRLSLKDKIVGRKVLVAGVSVPKMIKSPSNSKQFCKDIENLTFKNLERRGKFLIAEMSNDYYLVGHLGMTGLLMVSHSRHKEDIPEKYRNHVHVVMALDNSTFLVFSDIRRFGSLRLVTKAQLTELSSLKGMGPEPWDVNVKKLVIQSLTKKKWETKTIKEALMDQGVIAGIGNIYASEILYKTKILPNRLVSKVSEEELKEIIDNTQLILKASIDKGGTSVSDYLNSDGKRGTYQNELSVYGKTQCPNGHVIESELIKGRNTFYCTICQH